MQLSIYSRVLIHGKISHFIEIRTHYVNKPSLFPLLSAYYLCVIIEKKLFLSTTRHKKALTHTEQEPLGNRSVLCLISPHGAS